MRIISSSVLLLIFLAYNAGYYIVYLTASRYHKEYWENTLISANNDDPFVHRRSVPLTLPYQPDQQDFLPVHEVFESDGKMYRILQQRYAKDTLHIVYIDDREGSQLINSLRSWLDTLSEKQSSGKARSVADSFIKIFIPCYFEFTPIERLHGKKKYNEFINLGFISPLADVITPPPKAFSSPFRSSI